MADGGVGIGSIGRQLRLELGCAVQQHAADERRRQADGPGSERHEALELFTEQGFADTTVRQVAERAGVSDQTIYKAFGDKIGLLYHGGIAYIGSGGGGQDADLLTALRAEPDPLERIRLVARDAREQWTSGALELDLMLFGGELRDPRLEELQRRSLAYRLASTRAVCEVLFPDEIRHPRFTVDEIAEFSTALDSAAVVTTLQALGWNMDRWEQWVADFLALFLDPSSVYRSTT